MHIGLADHFNYKKLFLFTLPSVGTMVFTSVYGIVDGYFVSNFTGKTAFAAVNFIMPFLMILGVVGSMFGAGGAALVSKTLGEGDRVRANRIFSLLVALTAGLGVAFAALGIVFLRPIALFLGADDAMAALCVRYGRIVLLALPFFMLQFEFQSFLIVTEKPRACFRITLAAGIANMALDALLVGILKGGVEGAAAATAVSQVFGGSLPLLLFFGKRKGLLSFQKPLFSWRTIGRVCANGSSEFVANISVSVISMLYNAQLMRYIGEDGVSAYGTFMYISMIFIAIFIGYSAGVAPVVGFHFGANNTAELRSLLQKSLRIVIVASVGMVIFAQLMATPLAYLFVGYNETLFAVTRRAISIASLAFLFSGVSFFSSSFFTALNNGGVSALISFVRTMLFETAAVLLLPLAFGVDGIWISMIVSEACAAVLSAVFLTTLRKKYGYGAKNST